MKIDVFNHIFPQRFFEKMLETAPAQKDIGKRVLRKLLKRDTPPLSELKEKVAVIAHVLSPSDTATLPKGNIVGFVTDIGGTTSHTAIIARSLSIPAVVGVETATKYITG